MRRSAGGGGSGNHYGDDSSGGNNPHAYTAAPSPHLQQLQQQNKAEHHQNHNQWRWERDGAKLPSPMSPHMYNEVQGNEASRPYYQAQRLEPRMGTERLGSHDLRSQPRGEEMGIRYEENFVPQSFEGLEQKFLDDIMKLTKEQNDAEDIENARHRERINVINVQYQEQLHVLRARHATRREELLRRESHLRQQQFQQASKDHYPGSGPNDPRGYSAVDAPAREPPRSYDADSQNERARFLGSGRSNEFEPRVQYPGGRVYDTGSRYY